MELSALALCIELTIGVFANGNVHEGFSPDQQNGAIGMVEISCRANNFNFRISHYSEIDDGFSSTDYDRTYFGVTHTIKLMD